MEITIETRPHIYIISGLQDEFVKMLKYVRNTWASFVGNKLFY